MKLTHLIKKHTRDQNWKPVNTTCLNHSMMVLTWLLMWDINLKLNAAAVGGGGGPRGPINWIANPSFEKGADLGSQDYISMNPGSVLITGWQTVKGQIDYVGPTHWKAAEGNRSVDLDGTPGPGGIQQTVKTIPGQRYLLEFSLAPNRFARGPVTMEAIAGKTRKQFTAVPSPAFDPANPAETDVRYNMGWKRESMIFTATGSRTTIRFESRSTGESIYGSAIDSVSLVCASDNLLKNGGFEMGVHHDWDVVQSIPEGGIIDAEGAWSAKEGGNSVHLVGHTASINQVISTKPGTAYRLYFWMSYHPFGPRSKVHVRSQIGDLSRDFEYLPVWPHLHNSENLQWRGYAWDFVASSTETPISFMNLSGAGNLYGPVLDDVSVKIVCTPGAYVGVQPNEIYVKLQEGERKEVPFEILNGGTESLAWEADPIPVEGLSLSASKGAIFPQPGNDMHRMLHAGKQAVTLGVDALNLKAGVYKTSIALQTDAINAERIEIHVTIEVTRAFVQLLCLGAGSDSPFPRITGLAFVDTDAAANGHLGVNNLSIFEDGFEMLIDHLTTLQEGIGAVDIVFVIDTSVSMVDVIESIKKSATDFASGINAAGIDARLGLVTFVTQPELRLDLTRDIRTFQASIDLVTTDSGGDEVAYDAVAFALNELTFDPGRQKFFILSTDELSAYQPVHSHANYALKDVARLLKSNCAPLIAITGDHGNTAFSEDDPRFLAVESGGFWINIDASEDFHLVLDRVQETITQGLLFSYTTTNLNHPDKSRDIRLIVNDHVEGVAFDTSSYLPQDLIQETTSPPYMNLEIKHQPAGIVPFDLILPNGTGGWILEYSSNIVDPTNWIPINPAEIHHVISNVNSSVFFRVVRDRSQQGQP